MLPKTFNDYGVLPPMSQDYEVTFSELRRSLLVLGPEPCPLNWQVDWRGELVDHLEILVNQLWNAGITRVYVNGSFVQNTTHPADIDGCFECDYEEFISGRLSQRLNATAPKKIWGWADEDHRMVLGKLRLSMWASYKVEMYPFSPERPIGMRMNTGEFRAFPDAYRWTKEDGRPKGILLMRQE